MEVNKLSNTTGIGDDYYEKKLYRDKESPIVFPVVQASISKAEKRLKKLERDYQNTCNKYTKIQSDWPMFYIEARNSRFPSRREVYCIRYYKNQREQLQNNLDKLNKTEATEKSDHSKKLSMLHSCKSLAQEKMVLQQIGRKQHQENNGLIQETIKLEGMDWKFHYYQSIIPKSSSKKPIHKLLRKVKETDELREKAISNGKLVDNSTTRDSMTDSIKIEIKLFTKVIKKLEKEKGETTRMDNCWHGERSHCICMEWDEEEKKYIADYQEKMERLKRQCENICENWDEEKKYIVSLKNIRDGF